MNMYNALRIIESDLLTLEKLNENPQFYNNIIIAKNIAESLQITDSEVLYYTYQVYLSKLKGVSFFELTAVDRFNDILYYNKLIKLYEQKNPKSQYHTGHCKIIPFKRKQQ